MAATAERSRADVRTRVEHALDSRSVPLAAWLYRRTGGRVGHLSRRTVLLLTTTGRRTGRERTVVLQGFPDGDDLLVVAANSGMPRHPAWYLNLLENPRARVELDDETFTVISRPLDDAAAAAMWPLILEVAPDYRRFTERTDRDIPVVRLVGIPDDDGDGLDGPDAAPADPAGIYRSADDRQAVLDEYDRLADGWPLERRDLDVDTEFGAIHVIDSGPLDGSPVVLLHAASMGAISWAPNVAALAEAGLRTYAVDHPGEANRSVLADPTRFPADDDMVARFYDDVLDRLGLERCALVGASAGGQRAIRLTLARPDRVSHLALLGPMGLTPLGPSTVVRMMLASMRPSPRRIASTTRWALGEDPSVIDRYGRWFELAVASVVSPPRVARPTSTPARLLSRIDAPTLVVLAADDHLVGPPGRAARRATHLPDCTIRVVPGSHLVNVQQAAEVNRLLVAHLS